MIGIFDSGKGGHNTLRYVRYLYPEEDIILLTDRKNSPYGKRSEDELRKIVTENIRTLRSFGAEAILIGCCTASGVWDRMEDDLYRSDVVSIIAPTVREAKKWTKGKAAVIATEATVSSHSFQAGLGRDCTEIATQELVALVDSGISDNNITVTEREQIEKLLSPLSDTDTELLILGCTHFGSLLGTVSDIAMGYGIRRVIDSAQVGASELRHRFSPRRERGVTYYLTTEKA